jgi:hypothetical protein
MAFLLFYRVAGKRPGNFGMENKNAYIRSFPDLDPVNNEVAPGLYFRFYRQPVLRILL